MKTIIIAGALALGLAACSGGAQHTGVRLAQDAGAVTSIALSAADVAQLRATCDAAGPALAVATAPGMPAQIKGTAVYPAAYCAQLAGGALPSTTDAATPAWLANTLSAVQVAAKVAGYVLPVVLPLL